MKKLFIAALVVGLLAAFAVSALAQDQDPNVCDVSFDVDVLKVKNIAINKAVNKAFNFSLNISIQTVGLLQWAEVEAFKCDRLSDNDIFVSGFLPTNHITNSFNAFTGIGQVNQAAGILNNQGNVMAAGLTGKFGDQINSGLTMVEAAVEKTITDNSLAIDNCTITDDINQSFNSFTGLAQVNQAAGFLNNQNNVLALGANIEATGLVAENDTFLSMQNMDNTVAVTTGATSSGPPVVCTANLANSFNAYTGVAQVNQAPGFLNNQANIVSIGFAGRQAQ